MKLAELLWRVYIKSIFGLGVKIDSVLVHHISEAQNVGNGLVIVPNFAILWQIGLVFHLYHSCIRAELQS